jgi:hypothetical protein
MKTHDLFKNKNFIYLYKTPYYFSSSPPHSTPHIYRNFNHLIEDGIQQGITTNGL